MRGVEWSGLVGLLGKVVRVCSESGWSVTEMCDEANVQNNMVKC